MSLVLLAGLPGSGKSYLLKVKEEEGWRIFDDFHAKALDDDPAPHKAREYPDLVECLRSGERCMVADIAFCAPSRREVLTEALCQEVPGLKWELWCFENDPGRCRANLDANAAARLEAIDQWTTCYVIPNRARRLQVWRGP